MSYINSHPHNNCKLYIYICYNYIYIKSVMRKNLHSKISAEKHFFGKYALEADDFVNK